MAETCESITLLRCPSCGAKTVVQRPSGDIVIFQRAVLVRQGRVLAVCSGCRAEIGLESVSYETRRLVVNDAGSQDSQERVLTTPGAEIRITVSGAPVGAPSV